MAEIVLSTHKSWSYSPRTYANASNSDLTIALATDYSTAGERLTKKAAKGRYLALPLREDPVENARALYRYLRSREIARPVINVAGNGMHSLAKAGLSQEEANLHLYRVLQPIHEHWGIARVISGGQTGIDMAGGIAAAELDIPIRLFFPADFRQRDADGVDDRHTEAEIQGQIDVGRAALARDLRAAELDEEETPTP